MNPQYLVPVMYYKWIRRYGMLANEKWIRELQQWLNSCNKKNVLLSLLSYNNACLKVVSRLYFVFSGEYLQNRCNITDPNCPPCPKRLPSCVGHPDGANPFPNKLWKADYITCYKNRTLNVTHCSHGYFNLRTGKCEDDVPKGRNTYRN